MDLTLRSNINYAKFHFNRRATDSELHSIPLTPPSPRSLEGSGHPSFTLGHPTHTSLPPEPSTPLQIVSISQGSYSSSLDWQPCTQPPSQLPCSPISMTGLDASPRDLQRHSFLPSPLLSDDLASSSEDILYPSGPSSAVMSSRSGLGTPPGSTRSNSAEIDHNNPYRTGHSVYSPGTMSNDYLSGTSHTGNNYEFVHGREPPRGSVSYTRTSPTRRSPGLSPRYTPRSSSPYHYNPYVDRRISAPQPHEYHHTEIQPLPLPMAVPKRTGETIPSLNYPMVPQSPSSHPYHTAYNGSPNTGRYEMDWMNQSRGRSYSESVLESCGTGFKCTRCRYTAGSPEQLTKHQQKHLKLHHCRFASCSRTEGFATPNDRERHEKSIHKIPGQYWKCMDEHCSSFGKEFSRRDNLKDHLRRMHPVREGMSEIEAGALRSKMADNWRFDKGTNHASPIREQRP
ncbi:hypothetical protein EDC01DRAFT_43835 [Geopyxis carbonaria]|nr:hypothetical protein EDC01DRAFT_43835 [Geopyxis carbonaria]